MTNITEKCLRIITYDDQLNFFFCLPFSSGNVLYFLLVLLHRKQSPTAKSTIETEIGTAMAIIVRDDLFFPA